MQATTSASRPQTNVTTPDQSACQQRLLISQLIMSLLYVALAGVLYAALFLLPGLLCCLLLGFAFDEAIGHATLNYWCLLMDAAFWGLAACCVFLLLDRGHIQSSFDRADS